MAPRASTPTDPGCAGLHLLFTRLVAVALTFAPLAAPSATLAAPTTPSTPSTPTTPLRLVPGLHVAQRNSHSWAISSRGFSSVTSEKLLVLSDTRSIYSPLFSGLSWEVQDFLLEDIERIEVIRGPGAALWGSNAVNGVINIGRPQELLWGVNYRFTCNDNVGKGSFAADPRACDDHLLSAFVRDQLFIGDALRVTLGTKLEHNDFRAFEVQPSVRAAFAELA